MMFPWDRWYSTSCCLCCHVRTGTIILGIWYMLINAVVLHILLIALSDPDQYHLTSAELANDLDVMDDAHMSIATAISLLMILICGMATYGAYKPGNFPYKDEIMSMSNACLVFIVVLFISCILTFKAYLIGCVWNCYRYVSGRGPAQVLLHVTFNDTTVLLPPYDDTMTVPANRAPPPYTLASTPPYTLA
ncbi:hypothetical protein JZ751_023760 [Albula glossodonta]|uniref:Lysosomal-associated transmembrane protein 4B n=1 Tax=Albula glossodonta TaxID=121402 RepID=A0A8T2NSP1_9TELE|nr:hypothetical protein JZ751_023760 [Albula glossodonta]